MRHGDGGCDLAKGDHIGYVAIGPFDPVANDAFTTTITDDHVMDIPGDSSPCTGARPFGDMLDMNALASGFDLPWLQSCDQTEPPPQKTQVLFGVSQAQHSPAIVAVHTFNCCCVGCP